MKKMRIFVCALLCLCLSGCGKSEFMDLSGFVSGYNSFFGEAALEITDFTYGKSEGTAQYTAMPYGEETPLLIILGTDLEGKISTVRIFLSKTDEKSNHSPVDSSRAEAFFLAFQSACGAFCRYDKDEVSLLTAELFPEGTDSLDKIGELTKTVGGFHFVFYSTDIACEGRITNTHLRPVATTKKPVSRPYFADDEVTRETANPNP